MDDVAVGGGLCTGHALSPMTMATIGGLAIGDDLSDIGDLLVRQFQFPPFIYETVH